MLGEALAFPRNDDNWLKTIGIGGLLVLGGAFFVPIIPVYGFLLQTVRAGALKERQPPRFEDWEQLFIDGIKMFAVMFILVGLPSLVFVIVLFVAVLGVVAAGASAGSGTALGAIGIVVGLLVLVFFLLIVATGYVFPVALARLALEDDFSAAFDIGEMKRAALDWDFFVAWLTALAIGMTLGLIASVLTLLLVGVFLSFFVQVVVFYLLGWGVGEALDIDPGNYPPGPGVAPAGAGPGPGPGPGGAHGGQQQSHRGPDDQQYGEYRQNEYQQGTQGGSRQGGHQPDERGGYGEGEGSQSPDDVGDRDGSGPGRYREDYSQFGDDDEGEENQDRDNRQ